MDQIIELLSETPLSKKGISEALRMNVRSTQYYVTYLRTNRLIYVSAWKKDNHKPVQFFMAGSKKDAPKPKALTLAERSKRYRKTMDKEKKDFYLAKRRANRWADKWSKVAPPETLWMRT